MISTRPVVPMVSLELPGAARSWPVGLAALVISIGFYYFLPGYFALPAALVFVAAAWLRLDLALLFAIVTCPFYRPVIANPFPAKGFDFQRFSLVEFVIVACVIAWLVRVVVPPRAEDRPRLQGRAAAPVLVFVLAAAVSAALAVDRQVAFRELRVVIVEPALFGLMGLTVWQRRDVPVIVWTFAGFGAAIGLFTLYHYFVVKIVEATGGVGRALAVYHSPNQLALLFDRLVPVAIALVLPFSPVRRWVRQAIPAAIALIPMAAGLFLTYSRGAWLAVGAAAAFAAMLRGWRMLLVVLVLSVLGGGVVLSRVSLDRLISEQTGLTRVSLWQASLQMAVDHPVFGVGPDNFLTYYRDRGYLPPGGSAEPDLSHPHNLLLDAWLRTGILGLTSLTAAVALFGMAAFRILRGGDTGDRTLAIALSASMTAALVHSLFDNGFFLIDLAVLFWAVYVAMILLARETTEAA